jgi:DNA-directed RNA polymerase specialized sigma subunit
MRRIWKTKLQRALQADRLQNQLREAHRIAKFLPKKDRQRLAFDLVFAWGLPQEITARQMGISQAAVAKLLKKFCLKHPQLKPTIEDRPGGL